MTFDEIINKPDLVIDEIDGEFYIQLNKYLINACRTRKGGYTSKQLQYVRYFVGDIDKPWRSLAKKKITLTAFEMIFNAKHESLNKKR